MTGTSRVHVAGCSCPGCCTILRFKQLPAWGDDPSGVSVEIYVTDNRDCLGWRIKQAWHILLGRQNWSHCLMFERPQIEGLRDYLTGLLESSEE